MKCCSWLLTIAVLGACGSEGDKKILLIDASIGAFPDAWVPSMEIVEACTGVCERYRDCYGLPDVAGCAGGCAQDLADCTTEQVGELAACREADCGDAQTSPLDQCVFGVECVQGGHQ
jgi:hypothetical protein